MARKNKDNTETHEDMVSFVPGSSVIDIGELRRAQANLDSDDLSLDEEADLIRAELENDLELKKDVLQGFDKNESNQNLERIADRVLQSDAENLAAMEKLASETSDELRCLNEVFIAEDKLLEGKMARETMEEAFAISAARSGKSNDEPDFILGAAVSDENIELEDMSEEDQALRSALPTPDENGEYNLDDLQSCIETLLFYSDRSVSLKKLKEMLEMPESEDGPLLSAISNLMKAYASPAHGFEVAEIAGGYQLRTKPSKAALLRKLAKVQVQRLSRGAMETLTIVSYKQPCTKDDIDQVRGVDSSHFIRTLLDRKLIEVSGRSEAAGRPMIYSTTDTFLEVFGLMDLKGLPPLHEIEAMVPQMTAASEGEEDPRVVQMRKMVHQMKVDSNHLDYNAKEDDIILQEIRDRVKAIDVTTPYLARQKQLADEGINGEEAELILAKEFGFAREDVQPVEPEADQTLSHVETFLADQQLDIQADPDLSESNHSES